MNRGARAAHGSLAGGRCPARRWYDRAMSRIPIGLFLLVAACGDDGPASDGSTGGGDSPAGNGAGGATSSGADTTAGGGEASASGSGGAAGATGSATGSTGSGTTGGDLPACVTDVVLLAEAFQSSECSFPIPPEHADGALNLVLEIGGSRQTLCWLASSQGCEPSGGWWYAGDELALCDATCTAVVETEGAKLYLWAGCPGETCL